jgi:replicative DNA helicase
MSNEQSDTGEYPEDQPVPTSDPDAERSILGGILLVNESLLDVTDIVRPEDFADGRHQVIFRRMCALASSNVGIDCITLADALKTTGELAACGGIAYLSSLDASVPTSGNLARYAAIVRDKSGRRALLAASVATTKAARGDERPTAELLAEAETRIFDVRDKGRDSSPLVAVGRSMPAHFQRYERAYEAHQRGEIAEGVATGFPDIDAKISGMRPGDLFILGGRPGSGKTSWALQVADNVATTGKPVVIFSLEMQEAALVDRLVSITGRVDGTQIRTGAFFDSDWPKLARAAEHIAKLPLFIRDQPGQSVLDMRAACRRIRAKHGPIALAVVDYAQLVRASSERDSRERQIASIAEGFKYLAKEANCAVLALSSLNRPKDGDESKAPNMSALKESGALEFTADCVAFMHKPGDDEGERVFAIRKQRSGSLGEIALKFSGGWTRFDTASAAPRRTDHHGRD